MPLAQVFLAGSLKTHRVDGSGRPSPNGRSDLEVAQWFRNTIERLAGKRIEVVVTKDPVDESISEEVRKNIRRADFMLCLFTKRCEDGLLRNWATSPYVLSESGYGACCLDRKPHDKQRMFAFIEEGVDRDQLGLAFPGDRVLPGFNRDNLEACEPALQSIVKKMVGAHPSVRPPYEPMTLKKTISIWRSGWVMVECYYGHRLWLTDRIDLVVPHTLWRVSEKLPEFATWQPNQPGDKQDRSGGCPFLRCIPKRCGDMRAEEIRYSIVPKGTSARGNEISLEIRFPKLRCDSGGLLEYSLYWGYPQAFYPWNNGDRHPNSAGLRTGDRGPVADATLILKFERDWTEELPRSIHPVPQWFTNDASCIPAYVDPQAYWHDPASWKEQGQMVRLEDAEDAAFEVFVWNRSSFHGQARVTWEPYANYHTNSPASPVDAGRTDREPSAAKA